MARRANNYVAQRAARRPVSEKDTERTVVKTQGGHPSDAEDTEEDEIEVESEPQDEPRTQGEDEPRARGRQAQTSDEPPAWAKELTEGLKTLRTDFDGFRQQRVVPRQPQQQAEPDPYDALAAELFVNPASALRKAVEMGRSSVLSTVTTQSQQQQAMSGFWSAFYEGNKHLRDASDVAERVLERNFDSWRSLSIPDAQEKLAEETDKEILRIAKALNKGKGPNKGTQLESGRGPGSGDDNITELRPKSAKQILNARAAARSGRKAAS